MVEGFAATNVGLEYGDGTGEFLHMVSPGTVAMGIYDHDAGVKFERLTRFEWVKEWLRLEEIAAELDELAAELTVVRQAPRSREEFVAALDEGVKAATEVRISFLFARILDNQRGPDIQNLGKHFRDAVLVPAFTEEEIREVKRRLPSLPGSLNAKERAKRIQNLGTKIKALESERLGLQGREFCDGTTAGQDARKLLVSHWRQIQGQARRPVGVLGQDLETCPPAEREAWQILVGKVFVNPDGRQPIR